MSSYEQLGSFYLGKGFDLGAGAVTDDLYLYDSKDLTTHAVILGMTGSGKTGLGVALLEEAAIDGLPAIVIDPKGDLGNLLLAFPDLSPSDFRPWVDESEAVRRGQTADAFAAETAARWRQGLADWGQEPARIARFRDAVETTIYTPGSNAGAPLTVLRSFAAPPAAILEDSEAMRDRVVSTSSGLLTLLGMDADPVQSREHVFLSNLFEHAWRAGRDLDLAGLVREVQSPPFTSIGVLDLESFYPVKERFSLAMALNGLLASPGFAAWMQGEPLDIGRLLWTSQGKPRLSILSIAHLNDAERMFFVTTLLNEVLAWVRAQSGTSSLRALLYMDEVFGYFPPTANPPSKRPMLTLLKQARAFGLGVVLATQNPVDLDYKGLGNAGTWFIGRLQTERDKARVLDGLEGASATAASYDRARLDATLSALRPRVFMACNAHADGPVLFQSRWALSYLRGPLTRPQIQSLAAARAASRPAPVPAAPYGPRPSAPAPAPAPAAAAAPWAPADRSALPAPAAAAPRPILPPDVVEHFFPGRAAPPGRRLEYRPSILGGAKVHYVDAKMGVDSWQALTAWGALPDELALDPWDGAQVLEGKAPDLLRAPEPGASFAPLSPAASRAKTYAGWQRALEEWIYRTRPLTGFVCRALKAVSAPGEGEGEFRARIGQVLRERRDADVEALKRKFQPKVLGLEDRIRTAEARIQREKSQATQAKLSTGISFGAAVLGALFGGRKVASVGNVGRAATAARGLGRASEQAQDVGRAEESLEVLLARRQELEQQVEAEVARIQEGADPASLVLEEVRIAPRKSDLVAGTVALVWAPFHVAPDGSAEPAL